MVIESREQVKKTISLSGWIKMENKTHQSHALAITLFSLCAKQVNLVNLSHIFYKSCNFFPAFTSAIEQLPGNQINQSNQISSSVLHDQGRGEDDLDAGKADSGCRDDGQAWECGLPRPWSPVSNRSPPTSGLCFAPLLVGLPVLGWVGERAQRLLCRSCSQSGSSSLYLLFR